MLAQNVTKVLNGQNLDKVLRDKIWWLSQLSHIYALLSEADLSIKADTWITSCANLLPSPKTLTSKPTKCYEPVKLKCFPHKRKKYILWIQYIHFAIHINTFWNLNNTTQQLNSTPHFRAQTRIEINARKSVILKCFTQQEAQCRQCVWIILVLPGSQWEWIHKYFSRRLKAFFVSSTINIEKPFSMRPDQTNLALPYLALRY